MVFYYRRPIIPLPDTSGSTGHHCLLNVWKCLSLFRNPGFESPDDEMHWMGFIACNQSK